MIYYKYNDTTKIDITQRLQIGNNELESVEIYRISILRKNNWTYKIRYWIFVIEDGSAGARKYNFNITTHTNITNFYNEDYFTDLIVLHQLYKNKYEFSIQVERPCLLKGYDNEINIITRNTTTYQIDYNLFQYKDTHYLTFISTYHKKPMTYAGNNLKDVIKLLASNMEPFLINIIVTILSFSELLEEIKRYIVTMIISIKSYENSALDLFTENMDNDVMNYGLY